MFGSWYIIGDNSVKTEVTCGPVFEEYKRFSVIVFVGQPVIEIINLSGMYDHYDLSRFEDVLIRDLKGLKGVKLYVDEEGELLISRSLGSPLGIHLIDIGDYHYITRLYLSKVNEAFDLLVLDNHRDDQEPRFPGLRSCGSWIRDSIESMGETLSSVKLIKGDGSFEYLKGSFDSKRPLYISLDKDILDKKECPTNWDQGQLSVSDVLSVLEAEIRDRIILGTDISGGVAPDALGASEEILMNERVDQKITTFLRKEGNYALRS